MSGRSAPSLFQDCPLPTLALLWHCTGSAPTLDRHWTHQWHTAPARVWPDTTQTLHQHCSARGLPGHCAITETAQGLLHVSLSTTPALLHHQHGAGGVSAPSPVKHCPNTGPGQVTNDHSVTAFLLLLVHRSKDVLKAAGHDVIPSLSKGKHLYDAQYSTRDDVLKF